MKILIHDIDFSKFPETEFAIFRSRVIKATTDLLGKDFDKVVPNVTFDKTALKDTTEKTKSKEDKDLGEYNVEKRAENYKAVSPNWTFDKLVISESLIDEILISLSVVELENTIFEEWGLKEIEPFPRSALNFHGQPGTGKTLAAHAIADKLQRNILITNYAQLESMYHGVGPKNIDAVFSAAERDNAVLFIDEADSLLSKRLLNVNQGSEQAINSMRSQLLINLERFKGIVIFATNLVKNYDYAFETRVKHIHFALPDEDAREKIWNLHIVPKIPKGDNVDTKVLAQEYPNFCGRDIKNVVISACLKAAKDNENLNQHHLISASNFIVKGIEDLKTSNGSERQLAESEKSEIGNLVKSKLKDAEEVKLEQ